jgi:hypothetical protein
MSKSERLVASIMLVFVGLLIWFGYNKGAEDLSVLLTVGGGIAFALVGAGNNDNNGLLCIALILVGSIFAFTSAGLLPAIALAVASILSAFACWLLTLS